MNEEKIGIIKKWHEIIQLPQKYKDEFFCALSEIELPDDLRIETYDFERNAEKRI